MKTGVVFNPTKVMKPKDQAQLKLYHVIAVKEYSLDVLASDITKAHEMASIEIGEDAEIINICIGE